MDWDRHSHQTHTQPPRQASSATATLAQLQHSLEVSWSVRIKSRPGLRLSRNCYVKNDSDDPDDAHNSAGGDDLMVWRKEARQRHTIKQHPRVASNINTGQRKNVSRWACPKVSLRSFCSTTILILTTHNHVLLGSRNSPLRAPREQPHRTSHITTYAETQRGCDRAARVVCSRERQTRPRR